MKRAFKKEEEAFISLLTVAYKQGIDINKLAAQYNDLPRQRINKLVVQVREKLILKQIRKNFSA